MLQPLIQKQKACRPRKLTNQPPMDLDAADGWIIADAGDLFGDDLSGDVDGGWVMADGGLISGVFFHVGGRPAYEAIDGDGGRSRSVADPTLSFLPPSVAVQAGSNGLLCLRGAWSTYYICNPATASLAAVPRPKRSHRHGGDQAVALVFDPDVGDGRRSAYLLVCAVETPPGAGAYRFETFSSGTGTWHASEATLVTEGRLVPSSGVSSAGIAYWRTKEGSVVAYDPEIDTARILPAPARCAEADPDRWVLGEAGGRICCACVTDNAMEVHALGTSDDWILLASFGVIKTGKNEEEDDDEWEVGSDVIVCHQLPWPLRFQSASLEVVLWVDGRVVVMDLESRRVRVREIDFDTSGSRGFLDFLSHTNTLAPVIHQGN